MIPFVSVILPIRNEARTIRRCLEAIVAQDYPADRYEVIVVDGMSDDGTREIVREFCEGDGRVRMLDNPAGIVPHAMNAGIEASRGEVIIRIDGHAFARPHFIDRSVRALLNNDCECAGGRIISIGVDRWSNAASLAMSSVFGVGNSAFRCSDRPGYVDTLAFGAYTKEVLRAVGKFDEELIRCQDDEYNYRLRSKGYKIYLDPAIKTEYLCKSTFKSLFKQYFQYGFWKVRVLQKHPKMMQPRQFAPPLTVLLLIVVGALSPVSRAPMVVLAVLLVLYVVLSVSFSTRIASRKGWRFLPILPVVFATLHFSYGFGFLCGLVRFVGRWQRET